MARQSQSLREKARLANIGGDIRLGQWDEEKGREAEKILLDIANKTKGLTKKSPFDRIMDIGKMLDPTRTLSTLDLIRKKFIVNPKKQREIDRLGQGLSSHPYANYLLSNVDMLQQQGKGSLDKSFMADLMSFGMGAGTDFMKSDMGKSIKENLLSKLDKPGLQTLQKYLPFLSTGDEKKKGLMAGAANYYPFAPQGPFAPAYTGPSASVPFAPGHGSSAFAGPFPSGGRYKGPSLLKMMQFAQPIGMDLMRGKSDVRVPTAPMTRRRSIRSRIR